MNEMAGGDEKCSQARMVYEFKTLRTRPHKRQSLTAIRVITDEGSTLYMCDTEYLGVYGVCPHKTLLTVIKPDKHRLRFCTAAMLLLYIPKRTLRKLYIHRKCYLFLVKNRHFQLLRLYHVEG